MKVAEATVGNPGVEPGLACEFFRGDAFAARAGFEPAIGRLTAACRSAWLPSKAGWDQAGKPGPTPNERTVRREPTTLPALA